MPDRPVPPDLELIPSELADRGPARPGDLSRRLSQLPPGHPSSRYAADGTRHPPGPRLRDLELPDEPRPLTDQEHAEHISDIRATLDQARAAGLATDQQYTLDPTGETWTAERDALHHDILEDLYGRAADVPSGHRAIFIGGLGGAGKSTILSEHAGIDRSQYLTINPDDIKEELARRGMVPEIVGLSPMESSDLVHEESSYLARRLAARAQSDGKNVIWDITMSSRSSTERRIDDLRSRGYTRIDGIFVDIPVETSVSRADARHREGDDKYRAGNGLGGRYVPPEVIRAQTDPEWGSRNRKAFEELKHRFDAWSRYDNSVDGRAPLLIAAVDHPPSHDQQPEERA